MHFAEYDSPVGKLLLTCSKEALTGLWMTKEIPEGAVLQTHPILEETKCWLDSYFRGESIPFNIPLEPEGTAFQQQVWQILLTIPWGQTRSYGSIARELAEKLGKKKMSAQAVGQALGRNPISIVIPCHRVVGTKGQLTGYAGGLEKKIYLLQHEGREIGDHRIL